VNNVELAPKVESQDPESGKFVVGSNPNPRGRPKGSKNKITLLRQSLELQLREQAAPDLPAVLNKAIELALEGDRQMIKLLLEGAMAKAVAEDKEVKEKLEINITGASPEVKQITVIEQPEETDNE